MDASKWMPAVTICILLAMFVQARVRAYRAEREVERLRRQINTISAAEIRSRSRGK